MSDQRDDLPKEEAERRAREVAHRMLTTPKKPAAPKSRGQETALGQVGAPLAQPMRSAPGKR